MYECLTSHFLAIMDVGLLIRTDNLLVIYVGKENLIKPRTSLGTELVLVQFLSLVCMTFTTH